MNHKKLRPCIVKVSVLGYFPLYKYNSNHKHNLLDNCILIFD